MAGLWSVAVGFGEDRLVQAAARQMSKLPYYHTFSHKSHEPSIELAEKLVKMSPTGSITSSSPSSGSEANDTVVKFVWYYNNSLGARKRKSSSPATAAITASRWPPAASPACRSISAVRPAASLRQTCHLSASLSLRGGGRERGSLRRSPGGGNWRRLFSPRVLRLWPRFIGEPLMGAGGVLAPPGAYWRKMQELYRSIRRRAASSP